jgi:hypothetical protein
MPKWMIHPVGLVQLVSITRIVQGLSNGKLTEADMNSNRPLMVARAGKSRGKDLWGRVRSWPTGAYSKVTEDSNQAL